MRYLARWGFPLLSFFIFEMAMVGRGLPKVFLRRWYSSSVM